MKTAREFFTQVSGKEPQNSKDELICSAMSAYGTYCELEIRKQLTKNELKWTE